ncbi:MAG TPA: hypothetical protein VGD64_08715 [Acidisarcina sp.]
MNKGKKNSRPQKEEKSDARLTARMLIIDAVSANVGRFIRYSAIVLVCRYLYYGVLVLSGRTTDAHFWVQVLANAKVSVVLPWAFGGVGVGFGLSQRSLRRRTVSTMTERIRRLEGKIDSGSALGGISPTGTTYPEN